MAVKVNGLNEVAKIVDKIELRKRIEKEFIDKKIKEFIAGGIDKKQARLLVKIMFEQGLFSL